MKIGHKTTIYRNLQMLNTTPNGEGHNVSIYMRQEQTSSPPVQTPIRRNLVYSNVFVIVCTSPVCLNFPFSIAPPSSSQVPILPPAKLPWIFCWCMQNYIAMVLFCLTNFRKKSNFYINSNAVYDSARTACQSKQFLKFLLVLVDRTNCLIAPNSPSNKFFFHPPTYNGGC